MEIIREYDSGLFAREGGLAISIVKRPWTPSGVDESTRFNGQMLEKFPDGFAMFTAVDMRKWGKDELRVLKDQAVLDKIKEQQARFGDKTTATAIVMMGSSFVVSLVRSLATGMSMIRGNKTTRYFATVDEATEWLSSVVPGLDASKLSKDVTQQLT